MKKIFIFIQLFNILFIIYLIQRKSDEIPDTKLLKNDRLFLPKNFIHQTGQLPIDAVFRGRGKVFHKCICFF